jgi:hypothetical protein
MSHDVQGLLIFLLIFQYVTALVITLAEDIKSKLQFLFLFIPLGLYVLMIVIFGVLIGSMCKAIWDWFMELPLA